MPRPTLLLVSDLTYPAQGRRYGDEDVWLADRLLQDLDVAVCSPLAAVALLPGFDVVLVRNSGPVIHYREAYESFHRTVVETGAVLVNPTTGRGDQQGKGYLLELSRDGAPVIPTVDQLEDVRLLPAAAEYVVKPLLGSDSVGLRVVAADDLPTTDVTDCLVQPRVDLLHEISFVFVGRTFHYAVHTPDRTRRWELIPYEPSAADLVFAQHFVDWNDLQVGVQRVDACRTREGDLLLVELEDLNPYLTLDVLPGDVRESFCTALVATLHEALAATVGR